MLGAATNGLQMTTTLTPAPGARTSLPPPPQLSVESAHAAATPLKTLSTAMARSQRAKLVIDPSKGVLSLHGPRDKRVELGDQPPRRLRVRNWVRLGPCTWSVSER